LPRRLRGARPERLVALGPGVVEDQIAGPIAVERLAVRSPQRDAGRGEGQKRVVGLDEHRDYLQLRAGPDHDVEAIALTGPELIGLRLGVGRVEAPGLKQRLARGQVADADDELAALILALDLAAGAQRSGPTQDSKG